MNDPTTDRTTVYMLGKCPIKDCKTRVRLVLPDQRIVSDRWGKHTECYLTPAPGFEEYARTITPYMPEYVTPRGQAERINPHRYDVARLATHRLHRLICDDHNRYLKVTTVKGIVNVDKRCDGRCMGATGPNCECSCGGANHGASWSL